MKFKAVTVDKTFEQEFSVEFSGEYSTSKEESTTKTIVDEKKTTISFKPSLVCPEFLNNANYKDVVW